MSESDRLEPGIRMKTQAFMEEKRMTEYWDAGADIDAGGTGMGKGRDNDTNMDSEEDSSTDTDMSRGMDAELRAKLDLVVNAEVEAEMMAKREAEKEAEVEAEVEAMVSSELGASSSSDRELTKEAVEEEIQSEQEGNISSEVILDQENINKRLSQIEVNIAQMNQLIDASLHQRHEDGRDDGKLYKGDVQEGGVMEQYMEEEEEERLERKEDDDNAEEEKEVDAFRLPAMVTPEIPNVELERDTTTPLHLGGDNVVETVPVSGEQAPNKEVDETYSGSINDGSANEDTRVLEKEPIAGRIGEIQQRDIRIYDTQGEEEQQRDSEEEEGEAERSDFMAEPGEKHVEINQQSLEAEIQGLQIEEHETVEKSGRENVQSLSTLMKENPHTTDLTSGIVPEQHAWGQLQEPNGITGKMSQNPKDQESSDQDGFQDSFSMQQNGEGIAPIPQVRHDPILTNDDEGNWESESSIDEVLEGIMEGDRAGIHPVRLPNDKLYSYPDYVATPDLSQPTSSNFTGENSLEYPLSKSEPQHDDKIVLPKHNKQPAVPEVDTINMSDRHGVSTGMPNTSATSGPPNLVAAPSGTVDTISTTTTTTVTATPRRVSSHQYNPFRVVSVSIKGNRKTSGGNNIRVISGTSTNSGEPSKSVNVNAPERKDFEAVKTRREEERAAREQQREEEEEKMNLLRLEKKYELLAQKCNKLAKEVRYLTRMLGEGKLSIEDSRKLKIGLERLQEYLDKKTKEKYETGVLLSRQLRRRIDRGENGQFWIGNK